MRRSILDCAPFFVLVLLSCVAVLARAQSAPAPPPAAGGQFQFKPNLSAPPFSAPPVTPSHMNQRLPKLDQFSPLPRWEIDPRMCIHPPQSTIGVLPPPIHVLPNIYPNLSLLYIQAPPASHSPPTP